MKYLDSIKNFTAYCNLDVNPTGGQWYQSATGLPNDGAVDECVIRQITYNSLNVAPDNVVYFIWSSISNDIIGSFTPASGVANATTNTTSAACVVNPQTRIMIKQPIQSQVYFQVMYLNASGALQIATSIDGNIAISIDMITYKK